MASRPACVERRALTCALSCLAVGGWSRSVQAQGRTGTSEERAADGEAFEAVQKRLMDRWTDVESVAVMVSRVIEPGALVQVGDIHHQRIALPTPTRVPHPEVRKAGRMR